ncbi:hypothetical protein KRR38_33755 [Novosphingobium sp. G106]|uniref:hypothetical protein n=1 Tax=Novosphingobium sp. G106 TaxID=2849500 RepID=UPI001C2D4AB9|nr:hypothetical protein [Novosphingobium sp. G106]MBV1692469.1 hypothetical protein [Novosphingobium sp. G106]
MQADAAAAKPELAGERKLNSSSYPLRSRWSRLKIGSCWSRGVPERAIDDALQPVAPRRSMPRREAGPAARGKKAMLLTADTKGDAKALAFQNKMVADLSADTGP